MPENQADPLFVEFLRRGPDADFETFCARHPDKAQRLRELHAQHELALANLRAADIELRQPQRSSALLASASPASGELLRRILAHGAKGERYSLRGEIARGGMGAILRVWDEDLNRELAMKVVLGSDGQRVGHATPEVDGRRISRFLEEAQITGQLDHPCIVPVHELGLDSAGHVYFTMRLVKGRDFGRILELVHAAQEDWTETRALNVVLRVCEAMAFAHSKGVVHRDLKPANVMVGAFGEVYVMDWGLARVSDRPDAHDLRLRGTGPSSAESGGAAQSQPVRTTRDSSRSGDSDSPLVTMEGDILGTPAYMPPEQARGRIEEISAQSDVYAIGAMLYHLLAGQMPFVDRGETKSNLEVLNALIEGAPRPLRDVRSDVPAELEAICEKAMSREISARYGDTLDLAEDLRAFLEGRVVKAYQTGAIVELRKWVLRNKALASAAAAAILFLVAGLIGSLWQKSKADANAVLAAERAEEAHNKGQLALASQALAEAKAEEAATSERRALAVRDFLTGMLSNADPQNAMEHDIPISRIVQDAAQRLDEGELADDPEVQFTLHATLGNAFQAIYRLEESERQLWIARGLLDDADSRDARNLSAIEVDLADTIITRGDYKRAEEHIDAALAVLDAGHFTNDRLRVRALSAKARCRFNLGANDAAIEHIRDALVIQSQLDGPDSEASSDLRTSLAFHLTRAGQLDEALAESDRAIQALENGSPRARVLRSEALRMRADARTEKGQVDAAIDDLEEALSLREVVYGPEALPLADVLSALSILRLRKNENEAGEALARRAFEIRQKLLGSHRDTASSITILADVLMDRGELAEARKLTEQALAMRIEVFGDESVAVADSLRRLARLEVAEQDYANAERHFVESAAIWEKATGPDEYQLTYNWLFLARLMRRTDRDAEARPLLERAIALRSTQRGPTHPATNEARDDLVQLLLETQDWTAAEVVLRQAIQDLEQRMRPGHPLIAYSGGQLGAALLGQGRLDEAEPLLLAGWEAIGDNPRVWAVNKLFLLDQLVALYTERGDEETAATYRAKADALR